MKIIKFEAENVKRLVSVEITPDGNMVQITGKNGAGKSSVLDSILWAVAGNKTHQAEPIRNGEEVARIKLDMGEVIVRREFKRHEKGHTTTRLLVESADGAVFRSPQSMLDKMINALSFDPLAFARMKSSEQYETVGAMAGIDLEAFEARIKDEYDERTEHNREAKRFRAQAEGIVIEGDIPDEPVDIEKSMNELSAIRATNQQLETQAADRVNEKRRLVDAREDAMTRLRQQKKELENTEGLIKRYEHDLLEMEKAPPLGKPRDVGELEEQIKSASAINGRYTSAQTRKSLVTKAKEEQEAAEECSKAIEKIRADLGKKIKEAKLPIDGLTIESSQLMFDGVPFEQASDAEQLRISAAIAMAGDHKLRVIRIRDGSLLDKGSLALLEEMAKKNDYQIWIEQVDESGKVGVVIEDGMVKQ